MKKHQKAAIAVGMILAAVSFIPVVVTGLSGFRLGSPYVVKVFLFPTFGVAVAAVLIFFSFFNDSNGK